MSVLTKLIEPSPKYRKGDHPFSNSDLKKILVPLLIEQSLQLVVGIADTLMVSYAGEAAVSGVSLDTMFYSIFIFMFNAVATGGSVVVAQYLGKGDNHQADFSASQIVRIAAVFSVACMILILLTGRWILMGLYGSVEADVMAACRTYLWIVTLSFPANALYNAGAAIFRSMGRTKTTMTVSILMNILNVIGNAIGIFALHTGAAGVAWPTTISWYFAAVVMVSLCFRSGKEVRIRMDLILRHSREMVKRILHIAIPNGLESGLFQASKVFIGTMIATYGTYQIAANGISQTLWNFSALMTSSMGPVFITVVGQCMGAGNKDGAEYYLHKLPRITFFLALAWNIVLGACLPLIVQLYDISEQTRQLVLICVWLHCFFVPFVQPWSFPLSAGLQATGDVKFSLYSSIFTSVFLRIIFTIILGNLCHMGVIGVTIAMISDWIVKAILDVIRVRSGRWREKKVI